MNLLKKMQGDHAELPARANYQSIFMAALGGFIAIGVIAGVSEQNALALVLGSFGASCVLVFGFPDVPFSQPRNVLIGHLVSSLSGLVFVHFFGPHWWSVAFAVAFAIAAMMLTRTVHPPAGSNPVIVYLLNPEWSFLLFPTLIGALLLVIVALIYNNMTRQGNYPKYW